jgi:hypothetical protein
VSHPTKIIAARLVTGKLLARIYRTLFRRHPWSPDGFRPCDGYACLDTAARYDARLQAERLASVVRWKMADLYLAEAAILTRQKYPTAVSLIFDAEIQLDGTYAVTVRAIYDASRQRLDNPDGEDEDRCDDRPGYSLLRDTISYAIEWDNDYTGTGKEIDFDRVLAGELR